MGPQDHLDHLQVINDRTSHAMSLGTLFLHRAPLIRPGPVCLLRQETLDCEINIPIAVWVHEEGHHRDPDLEAEVVTPREVVMAGEVLMVDRVGRPQMDGVVRQAPCVVHLQVQA